MEVNLNGNSIQLWGASPPSREELVKTLRNADKDVQMRFDWNFVRYVKLGVMSIKKHNVKADLSDLASVKLMPGNYHRTRREP